jgi:hypothetical protein
MTGKPLQSVSAILLRREAREAYRPKGWRESLLDMLRADVTNAGYLTALPRRRRPACDCG